MLDMDLSPQPHGDVIVIKNSALRCVFVGLLLAGSGKAAALTIEGLDLTVKTASVCEELGLGEAGRAVSASSLLRIRPCLTQEQSGSSAGYSLAETTTWLRLSSTGRKGNQFIGLGYRFEFQGGIAQIRIRSGDRLSLFYRKEAWFF